MHPVFAGGTQIFLCPSLIAEVIRDRDRHLAMMSLSPHPQQSLQSVSTFVGLNLFTSFLSSGFEPSELDPPLSFSSFLCPNRRLTRCGSACCGGGMGWESTVSPPEPCTCSRKSLEAGHEAVRRLIRSMLWFNWARWFWFEWGSAF